MLPALTLTIALAGATGAAAPCPSEARNVTLLEDPAALVPCARAQDAWDRLWGAHALVATGQFREAAALYRSLEAEVATQALGTTLRVHEARAWLAGGNAAEGVARLKGMTAQGWEAAELAAARADLLLAAGDASGALAAARQALKLHHAAPDAAWLTVARAAQRLGHTAELKEAVRRLQIDQPESPATEAAARLMPGPLPALSVADLASRWAHWTAHGGASAVAQECPERLKGLSGGKEKLAVARLQCGKALSTAHSPAAVDMLRSAAVGKSRSTALLALAQIAARRKDPKPVAKLCGEMASSNVASDRAECEFLVAFVTLQSGDHSATEAAMQKVIDAFPSHARASDAAWFIALDALHTKEAPDRFERLVAAAKDTADKARALYWRGRVKDELHLPGAADDWRLVLQIDPFGYYGWLASARLESGTARDGSGCVSRPSPAAEPPSAAKLALLLLRGGFNREAALELAASSATRGEGAFAWASILATVDQWERVLDIGVANGSRSVWPVSDELRQGVEALYPRAFPQALAGIARETNPCLVLAVMRRESRFNPDATSPAEAVGLLQLLPKTAASLAGELSLERPGAAHLHDPSLNVRLGAHYIRRLIDRFHSPLLAAAAYNAGAHAVANWTKTNANQQVDEWVERIPYRETRNYAKAVGGAYAAYALIYEGARPPIDWTPIAAAGDGIDY